MKKKFVVMTIAAIAVCGIGVYASGLGDTIISKFSGEQQIIADEYTAAFQDENAERESAINEALKNTGTQVSVADGSVENKIDKYSQMLIAMDATISDPAEFNDLLVDYHYLTEVYELTQEQKDYIADLVIDGCNMSDIIGLAYFWVDTNENISLIKSMYDLKGEFAGKTDWYGNAYDKVTDAKNGSLSVEEVKEYMGKGLTAEEILTADKLSRKGVYTINQILDKCCDGRTLLEVANEIQGGKLLEADIFDNEYTLNYSAIEDLDILVNSEEISYLAEESQIDIIAQATSEAGINNYAREKRNEKYAKIREELSAHGVLKSE